MGGIARSRGSNQQRTGKVSQKLKEIARMVSLPRLNCCSTAVRNKGTLIVIPHHEELNYEYVRRLKSRHNICQRSARTQGGHILLSKLLCLCL